MKRWLVQCSSVRRVSRVVTASLDNTARLWDAASGKPVGEPMPHEGWVRSAQFSPDGQRLVTASGQQVLTASWDQTARLLDDASGKPIGVPMKQEPTVSSEQVSQGKNELLNR